LEAKSGFYEKPIATLDFASLYPSIMMAYNLCYCTLVRAEDQHKLNLPAESVTKTPSGEIFVKPTLEKVHVEWSSMETMYYSNFILD
jgi:DNA polymerase delta subunit 1